MSWVPLHVHSQYSILDSAASLQALTVKAAQYGMGALALTDQGNMYGAVDFFKACKKEKIKPIIGCELYLAPGARSEKKRTPGVPAGFPVVLLAKNKQGYQNLCKLSSLAHIEGFYYTPRIDKELLAKYSEGLICLSGPTQGLIGWLILQGKEQELRQEIDWFRQLFKEDYYLELLRHEMAEEEMRAQGMDKELWLYQGALDYFKQQQKVLEHLQGLSKELGIPCVAANDSRYIDKEDWKAQEILANIQSGEPCEIWERDSFGNPKEKILNPKRQVLFSRELYFKSQQEMEALFSHFPEAISTTLEVAEKCNFEFDLNTKYYPVFVPPTLENKQCTVAERTQEAEKFLWELCQEGIRERYLPPVLEKVKEKYPKREPLDVVKERLDYEFQLITSKGMGDYLLIVYDFIAWAKGQKIPVGPGRGSGAGSIILYLIGVTDIEPLRFGLLFERFINPERISYPDIDVDICMERRAEVIDYTVRKYGKDKVAQIITFGTMKAKMAIKDVGRVLNIPLVKVNAIAKLVPEDVNMTLDRALEIDPELRQLCETDPEVKQLMDLAKRLEGSVRNTGIHAAGLIISGDPLLEHIPICTAKDSDLFATQYAMKPVEAVGMLKIDFLGLKTLTAIQLAADAIREKRGIGIDWVNLPLDDEKTFALLNQGKTLGLFQLESPGMQELARQLHIDTFEEIMLVNALYRPGPMEMIPSFINRKHGKEPIEIDHPLMKELLAETYGIMVYQEQVMQIASDLANYSLGEGDVLRKAMGKKDHQEMAKQREKFRTGALKKGIDEATAMLIFDKIEKFASYGFNKSHAAAYGYLSYVTAYLKANYPMEWMAALMTSDRDDLTKVAKIIRECQAMEIAILPPDMNESDKAFAAAAGGIRFALTAIKGVGEGVVDVILEERKTRGPFDSLYNFFKRIDTKKVGKKVVECLIEAGCFDFTKWPRQALLESIDPLFDAASREQKEAHLGIINLFSLIDEDQEKKFTTPPPIQKRVTRQEMLKRENELLGFYLTGHPLDDFRSQLKRLSCVPLSEIAQLEKDGVFRTACIIESVAVKVASKTQRKFAVLTISDGYERFELPIWSDMYEEKQQLLVENQLIYTVLQIESQDDEIKLQCRWMQDLTKVDEAMIQDCDRAFDRAKSQQRPSSFRDKGASQKKAASTKKALPTELHLKVDADALRFSHVLALKEIFRTYPGNTPVQIEFYSKESKVGGLSIDVSWGVEYHKDLEEKLKRFTAIRQHRFVEK